MGLVSKDHVWVMPVLSENWFRNVTDKEGASCSQADIENALLTNVLFIDPYPWDPDDNATADSGRVGFVCVHVCMCGIQARVYVHVV